MAHVNRDTGIAIFLLLCCGVLIWSSLGIRDPGYGMLAPAAWPQAVLALLTALCLVYLARSLRRGASATPTSDEPARDPGLSGWLRYYRNPILCYLVYFAFLASLPVFGALLGGILLVFGLLSVLGGFGGRQVLIHGVIAVLSVGAMWSLFTFALRVILPQGMIFTTL